MADGFGDWSWSKKVGAVLGGLVAGLFILAAFLFFGVGVGVGLDAMFDDNAFVGWPSTLVRGATTVAVAAGLVALGFASAGWVGDWVQRRVSDPKEPYARYLGVSVGVFSGLLSSILGDSPVLAFAVGAFVAMGAAFAAWAIQKEPWLGLAVYAALVAIVAAAVFLTTDAAERRQWIADRTFSEWVAIAGVTAMLVGVPLAVWLVERWREAGAGQSGRPRPATASQHRGSRTRRRRSTA